MAIENIVWIYALLFGVAALAGAALLIFAAQRVGKESKEKPKEELKESESPSLPESLPEETEEAPEDQGPAPTLENQGEG